MTLTPDTLAEATFTVRRRGYSETEVDAFLDTVAAGVRQLHADLDDARATIIRLRAELEAKAAEEPSAAAARLLVIAQNAADELTADAQAKAAELTADAQARADALLTEAQERADALTEKAQGALTAAEELAAEQVAAADRQLGQRRAAAEDARQQLRELAAHLAELAQGD